MTATNGRKFENQASQLLRRSGLKIVVRNFSARTGEIDIIALEGNHLVFVEVRARSNPAYSSAAGSVDRHKQRRILQTAQLFLQKHPELANLPCRFDVIAFEPPQSSTERHINWIRSAFCA
ncbi:MAG: putative endonuclease [Bacteroidia bacterium]|jgi:putative endonuclease